MIEAILDHLNDDKPSLKACSLVCKAWTHPAHLHLFATSALKWPLQPAAFPFVRHFRITMDVPLCDGAPTWDDVLPLLVGFHRIISLKVDAWEQSLNPISAQTWLALGNTFSRVVSLSLLNFKSNDMSSVAQIICAFPCLRKLSICMSIYSTIPEPSFATTFGLSPHLDTVELNAASLAAVLEWLLSLPVRPTLRTVRLYSLLDEHLASFHRFIRVFGNGLESLSLSTLIKDGTLPYLI
jgi:hypothetical protein